MIVELDESQPKKTKLKSTNAYFVTSQVKSNQLIMEEKEAPSKKQKLQNVLNILPNQTKLSLSRILLSLLLIE